jgi:hypothetical protein
MQLCHLRDELPLNKDKIPIRENTANMTCEQAGRIDDMSRAFVSENTGWGFCVDKHESCMFADSTGGCSLKSCRQYPENPKNKEPVKGKDSK